MQMLYMEATPTTPLVVMDAQAEFLEISGRSLPEHTQSFYAPVMSWLEEYTSRPNATTCLKLNLEYFSSGSIMILYKILRLLEGLPHAEVHWHYQADDEDILDAGKEMSGFTNIRFQFVALV